MKRSALLLSALALMGGAVAGSEAPKTNGIDPDYVYYIFLKEKEIIKADGLGPTNSSGYFEIITRSGDSLIRRTIHSDKVASIKSQKRPKTTSSEPERIRRALIDIGSDPLQYLDRQIDIYNATVTLSTYFNYGYRNNRLSHICFKITDGTFRGYVYADKDWDAAESLRQRLLKEEKITGVFSIVLNSGRYDASSSDVLAELIGYSIPQESR